uniref:hypothetical protein n=5 Tax=Klebsiella pneumoniae TaxID=573 RepID=UPI001D0E9974
SLPEGWGRCAAPKGPFSGHFSGCDADSGRGVPYDMGVIRLAEKGFELKRSKIMPQSGFGCIIMKGQTWQMVVCHLVTKRF